VSTAPADIESWTIGHVLRAQAAERPDAPCLTFEFGETLSYSETLRRSEILGAALQARGVSKGDRVALMMDNSTEFLLAWFAINLIGAVEAPVNVANKGRSLIHALNNSASSLALVDAALTESVAAVADRLEHLQTVVVVGAAGQGALPFETCTYGDLLAHSEPLAQVHVSYRDPAAIIYTSGTTGPAKGVLACHAHAYQFGKQTVDRLEIGPDDVYYVCLPLFHSNAQWVQVYAALIAGAHMHVARRFRSTRWLDDVRRAGATVSSLLGVMANFLWAQPEREDDRDHPLRRVVAIPMPASLHGRFEERFGIEPVETYGMTEISLPLWRPAGSASRAGSSGRPHPDFEVRLVDPDTDIEVAAGQVGEIVVRPRHPWLFFSGYEGMPEVTLEATRNLWFHTGDAGRVDEEGNWYFVDRIRDRIRRRGENVSSFDIEVAIGDMPGVLKVAAIGVPAADGDDDVKALLVTDRELDPVDVVEHCIANLPYFAVPRYLEFVEELPLTHNGKIVKHELRRQGLTGAEWDREAVGITVSRQV
jgi:crotonobetaine/carnitine-CoA ligase